MAPISLQRKHFYYLVNDRLDRVWGFAQLGHACLIAALALTAASPALADNTATQPFELETIAQFDQPWTMAFVPDGRVLVTQKNGQLYIVNQDGNDLTRIGGVPDVDYGGQGGLGDIALHPDFAGNQLVYFSYVESGDNGVRGAAVARARLDVSDKPQLSDVDVIWRQQPKVSGRGHYGHRLVFSAQGYLFITSGERQKFEPAQDMQTNLGKIIRLHDDGSIPDDNPFVGQGAIAGQVWSLGHRNPLGIAFDSQDRLWSCEMGPRGGDELNLIERGANYGYPIVSNGRHYSGRNIPDHDTRPEFTAPKISWTPVISPGGLMIYSGTLFEQWQGNGFLPGLSSQALIRVAFDGQTATEVQRFNFNHRVRAVTQGPNGALWLLLDDGALIKLTPKSG